MLTALIAVAVIAQDVPSQSEPKPAELVSRMLARYAQASTLTGRIEYVQSAGKESVKGQTTLQYQRPDKLYIRQAFDSWKEIYRVVSDGQRFTYSLPQRLREPGRYDELTEPLQQRGQTLDVAQIYAIGSSGLFDKSAPLDIAIGRTDDLRMFRNQLATLELVGQEKIEGQEAYVIGGNWRQYGDAPVSGTYRMAITSSGDLLLYTIKETVAAADAKLPPTDVTTRWHVTLVVNGKPDPLLFKR